MDRNVRDKYKIRWFTTVIYVDVDTGEILDKARVEREGYYVARKSKKVIDNNIIRTYECRNTGQTKLEFGIS